MDNLEHYKLIYVDPNVASNIAKSDDGEKLVQKYLTTFPPNEDNLLCFSTYTLYEMQKSSRYYERFKQVFSLFPCAIVISYFPLAEKEFDKLTNKITSVTPLLFAPVGLIIDGKKLNPDSLEQLLSRPEVIDGFNAIEFHVNNYLDEFNDLLDHKYFKNLKGNMKGKAHVFAKKFLKYELVNRFHFDDGRDVDFLQVKHLKSLELFAYSVFYKLFSDSSKKRSFNDVVDVLIMTTIPYVHTFISEANSIDVLTKIKRTTNLIKSQQLLTYKEFMNISMDSGVLD
tara:strand:+ start:538 stop:1389 length:852 start_codon:yes stop_codon:yes gene_type:complete